MSDRSEYVKVVSTYREAARVFRKAAATQRHAARTFAHIGESYIASLAEQEAESNLKQARFAEERADYYERFAKPWWKRRKR